MTATLIKIEDHEGQGRCGECQREGLRWIAVLDNGQAVGLECAKRIIGYRPAPKSYAWVVDFAPVAEVVEGRDHFVLWQHKSGAQTRETCNGNLRAVGGIRESWTRRGWIA